MSIRCPKCGSAHIVTLNRGKKTATVIGTAAGSVAALTTTASAARLGASAFIFGGPVATVLGGISGAIIGALVAGIATGTVASKVGEMVDESILDNHVCQSCGIQFSHIPTNDSPSTLYLEQHRDTNANP